MYLSGVWIFVLLLRSVKRSVPFKVVSASEPEKENDLILTPNVRWSRPRSCSAPFAIISLNLNLRQGQPAQCSASLTLSHTLIVKPVHVTNLHRCRHHCHLPSTSERVQGQLKIWISAYPSWVQVFQNYQSHVHVNSLHRYWYCCLSNCFYLRISPSSPVDAAVTVPPNAYRDN